MPSRLASCFLYYQFGNYDVSLGYRDQRNRERRWRILFDIEITGARVRWLNRNSVLPRVCLEHGNERRWSYRLLHPKLRVGVWHLGQFSRGRVLVAISLGYHSSDTVHWDLLGWELNLLQGEQRIARHSTRGYFQYPRLCVVYEAVQHPETRCQFHRYSITDAHGESQTETYQRCCWKSAQKARKLPRPVWYSFPSNWWNFRVSSSSSKMWTEKLISMQGRKYVR